MTTFAFLQESGIIQGYQHKFNNWRNLISLNNPFTYFINTGLIPSVPAPFLFFIFNASSNYSISMGCTSGRRAEYSYFRKITFLLPKTLCFLKHNPKAFRRQFRTCRVILMVAWKTQKKQQRNCKIKNLSPLYLWWDYLKILCYYHPYFIIILGHCCGTRAMSNVFQGDRPGQLQKWWEITDQSQFHELRLTVGNDLHFDGTE